MAVKKGLTYEQHERAGALLKKTHEDLTKLFVEVANAYPRRGRAQVAITALARALDKISIARSELEELAVGDCGHQFHIGIYYAKREEKAESRV
jgi:hypothetical protein